LGGIVYWAEATGWLGFRNRFFELELGLELELGEGMDADLGDSWTTEPCATCHLCPLPSRRREQLNCVLKVLDLCILPLLAVLHLYVASMLLAAHVSNFIMGD
jgi:hypothetical protein